MSRYDQKSLDNYKKWERQYGKKLDKDNLTPEEITKLYEEHFKTWEVPNDLYVEGIQTTLDLLPEFDEYNHNQYVEGSNYQEAKAIFLSMDGQINDFVTESNNPIGPSSIQETKEIIANKVANTSASIEALEEATNLPVVGSYDIEKSRFANQDLDPTTDFFEGWGSTKDDVFLSSDEEQIVEDVLYMLSNLPEEEKMLMAMEFANSGFYRNLGGFDGVFISGSGIDGEAYELNQLHFQEVLATAKWLMETGISTDPVINADFGEGIGATIPAQSGLGISLAYNIFSGQSGLTAKEIVDQFNEGKKEQELSGVTYYDPATIMQVLNDTSRAVLGANASDNQKQKFLGAMIKMVEHHQVNNTDRPDLGAQAELFLGSDSDGAGRPAEVAAAEKGSLIQALDRIVLGGR
tara:strand:- start:3270 stop:4490 length:1221 start_codon:yes stop_codon:yes gene_type:complete